MSKSIRRLRNVIVVMVMCWTAVAVFAARRFYVDLRDSKRVTAKIDTLRATSLPVDNATMDKWYRDHTDPDHMEAWLKVLETLSSRTFRAQSRGVEGFDRNARGNARTAHQWPGEAAARKLLAETTELREEIRRLAQTRVPVRFPIEFQSTRTNRGHIQPLRQASRLIALELSAAIADKNSAQIVAAVQTLLDLAVVLRREYFNVQQLSNIAIRDLAFHALKESLERDLLASKELELLSQSLPQEPVPFDYLQEIVQAERALLLPLFIEPTRHSESKLKEVVSGGKPVTGKAAPQDVLHFLEQMEKYESLDGISMTDALARQSRFEQQMMKDILATGKVSLREWQMTKQVFPAWGSVLTTLCHDRQRLNMVLHGIAIRRYQDQFGKFPQDLAALKDIGFNADDYLPVGGKPMGYKIDGTDVILWSNRPAVGEQTSPQPPIIGPAGTGDFRQDQLLWKMVP